jgi:hypothetical protein
MPKDESGSGRETQGRGRRTSKAETTASVPLVSAKRGKFTPLTDTRVDAVVYARLSDYKTFVREIEGEEPDEGAIVSAALEMLFEADKGFERWLNDQRRKSRQPSDGNIGKVATRVATTNTSVGSAT